MLTSDRKSIADLQAANLPVATHKTIGLHVNEGVEPDADTIALLAVVDSQLCMFAEPTESADGGDGFIIGKHPCLCCGRPLSGMLGTFQWGICHGEGKCTNCGWPARALHYIKDGKGEDLFDRSIPMVLQYHPSQVSSAKGEEDADDQSE